ncbi:TetR/AcrR family transcriptional regulator (plasmid) [Streptomyces sp. R39]|uniref:TetR/AcrR family transcriptional regulator n=1 Tax=Streptomyces sp. R39 TaxID=3238631 RepID=A0AB39R5K3_9ACTN
MGTTADQSASVARRERNPRGQGDRLRNDVIAALARIVSDDERMRPVSVSLRELAREAGVTAPAIYAHFASVSEVAWAAAQAGFAQLVAAMDTADEQAADRSAADRLIAQAHAYCRFAVEQRGHFRLMFAVEPAVIGARLEDAAPPVREVLQRWQRAAARLREDGVTMTDTATAAMYLWSAVHGRLALTPLLTFAGEPSDVHQFVEQVVHEIIRVRHR